MQQNGGLVRVGLKNTGDSRGTWRGQILISDSQRRLAVKELASLRGVALVDEDPILPIVTLRVPAASFADTIGTLDYVDYLVPATVPSTEIESSSDGACENPSWDMSRPLSTMPNGMSDQYSQALSELRVDRAWSYASGSLVTIGSVDTGVEETTRPELIAMYGRLTVLQPNSGGCSHGSRMALVAAAPANNAGSVGVAFHANLVTSDLGSSVVPSGVNAYDAVHRLYLSGGMPTGSKIIMFGFGLSGDYPDLSDLIDLGYYTRGFAFFSPAGSAVGGWPVVFPATKSEVFAVTARTSLMEPHPSAHLGPQVDGIAFAPLFVSGTSIVPLSSLNVTSAATAQVAGVAALVLQRYPTLSNAQLYNRLKDTSREYCGPTWGYTTQIINAEAAVGGLCVPEGQFNEVTYTIYPDGPQTITHQYCLSFSGGVWPSATIQHVTPNPNNPLCGSVTTGPQEGSQPGYITIPVSIQDAFAPNNPPITNAFRIKIVRWTCPPETPNCI